MGASTHVHGATRFVHAPPRGLNRRRAGLTIRASLSEQDTSIPGPREFPSTAWSRLVTGDKSDASRWLVSGYWKPAYLYIRRRWKRSNEDAKDLAQGFFADALDKDLLSRANPDRGSFRKFLRTSLENFLRNAARDAGALKRGGGATVVPLEAMAEAEASVARAGDPDALYNREWAETVLERCIPRLREAYEREGRGELFEVFRRYDYDTAAGRPTYEELAKEFGKPATDIRNWLVHARARWQKLVREELRETAGSDEALEAEVRELFGR